MCRYNRLPQVSNCCCYISLRIGAYLIGFLQSIFGLGIIVYALTYHSSGKEIDGQHTDDSEYDHNTGKVILRCEK